MELREGYKQTEVGVIPEDWDVVSLGDNAIKVGSGITPKGGSSVYKESGRPFMRSQNVGWGVLKLNDIAFIDEETHASFPGSEIKQEDVLLNITGASIGRCTLATFEIDGGNVNQHVCIIRTKGKSLDAAYLCRVLLSDIGQGQIDSFQAGGNREGLNFGQIKSFNIPLPPTKTEQTAIANALSDADALIQSLTRLIAKKRQIKQGAMQTLLNPYENGHLKAGWVVKKLGDISDILTGFPFPSSGYVDEGTKLLRGSNIKRGVTDWSDHICQYWPETTTDLHKYKLIEGDIVVAMDGSLVGKSFAQLQKQDLPSLLLQRVARIRVNSNYIDVNYIKEWVCSELFTLHCDALKTVTAIPHISPADIFNFELNIPDDRCEQTRIATILSDMDADIAALETKLTKTRHIKQGMMQSLLTGRIRLI